MTHLMAVTVDELQTLLQLCRDFGTQQQQQSSLSAEWSGMLHLAEMVRDGPGPTATDGLRNFHIATKRMMLCRSKRDDNDVVTATFQPRPTCEEEYAVANNNGTLPLPPVGGDDALRMMVDHSMDKKKQHEVHIMRKTMRSLLRASSSLPEPTTEISVLNIGEGKGYVSRVLALCDGYQVVGLDCNPNHKEGSSSRLEKIVEGRLGSSTTASEGASATGVGNLMYCRRGHMASITCRVGKDTDWTSCLKGHVELRNDQDNSLLHARQYVEEGFHDAPLDEKMQCVVCGHIMRRHTAALVVKHAKEHVIQATRHGQGDRTTCLRRLPVFGGEPQGDVLELNEELFDQWLVALPQSGLVQKLCDVLFTMTIVYAKKEDLATQKKQEHTVATAETSIENTIKKKRERSDVVVGDLPTFLSWRDL